MRTISTELIKETTKELLLETNVKLSDTFLEKLKQALRDEKSNLGKDVIEQIILNNEIAQSKNMPLCQDWYGCCFCRTWKSSFY